MDARGIQPIVEVLAHGSSVAQGFAAAAIGNLANCRDNGKV